jgi:Zn-dependent peptidase ImmA (M78 family)/DNA-binding XRE family transcriptional regulator
MNAQQPNHEMIVLAREIRGMTQTELARLAPSATQGNLSRMEKGKLSISENVLEEISEVLNFPKSFFFQENVKTPISDFYYRKRVTIPKKKLSRLEANMDLIRISLDKLFADIELPPLRIPHMDTDSGLKAEEAARKIRSILNLRKGPVKNLVGLLEQNGVVVFPVESDSDKFDGITLFTDDRHVIIFLNRDLPNDRKRFTLAHELGHLTLHLRAPFDERPDSVKEDQANQFASEFLMPELDIRNDLAGLTMTTLGTLKSYWQVSMKSLIYRAQKLRIISERRAQNLYIELSRLGYVKNEPGFVEFDEPRIVRKAIQLLRDELDYTNEEIAGNLSISLSDFLELFLNQKQNIIQLKSNRLKENGEGESSGFFSH